MEYREFIQSEIDGLDEAVRLAKRALKTTVGLQNFYEAARVAQTAEGASEEQAFTRDTLKFFDTNNAVRDLESLQLQLGELKNKLIEVKIANDRKLFAGGYLLVIDECISRIFLKNTLCKLQAEQESTPAVLEDSIQQMIWLKEQLIPYLEQK